MHAADNSGHGRSRLVLNDDFRRVWTTEAVLSLGGQITAVVVPIVAALYLHASPSDMGLLGAMGRLPQLALGLLAGAFVDRLTRRSTLAGINFARALAVAAIPLTAWFGALDGSVCHARRRPSAVSITHCGRPNDGRFSDVGVGPVQSRSISLRLCDLDGAAVQLAAVLATGDRGSIPHDQARPSDSRIV